MDMCPKMLKIQRFWIFLKIDPYVDIQDMIRGHYWAHFDGKIYQKSDSIYGILGPFSRNTSSQIFRIFSSQKDPILFFRFSPKPKSSLCQLLEYS